MIFSPSLFIQWLLSLSLKLLNRRLDLLALSLQDGAFVSSSRLLVVVVWDDERPPKVRRSSAKIARGIDVSNRNFRPDEDDVIGCVDVDWLHASLVCNCWSDVKCDVIAIVLWLFSETVKGVIFCTHCHIATFNLLHNGYRLRYIALKWRLIIKDSKSADNP